MPNIDETKPRILTVGDGDLSLSLALARAYGDHVELKASVLDSESDLHYYYPNAPVEELQNLRVEIIYGLDATQLHTVFSSNSWDLICFHHPHLGLGSLEKDESEHANRHFQLLCHYLYSASQVSNFVHICLCGSQSDTWRLFEASRLSNMKLLKKRSTTVPFCQLWTDEELDAAEAQPTFAAPRRYRYGRLGSRHMLGKYGYRHRRTEGERYKGKENDTNVSGSMHFVFESSTTPEYITEQATLLSSTASTHFCSVCRASFSSKEGLSSHLAAPAMPQIENTTIADNHTQGMSIKRGGENRAAESNTTIIPCFDHPNTNKKELKVLQDYDGRRLRWFIRHGIKGLSKKQAESSIVAGEVLVNGAPVLDSSRILRCGDTIIVGVSEACKSISEPPVEILHRKPPLLVAFKPGGMRTKGQFPKTLEFVISEQEGTLYSCLTPLDTSCAGLCVLLGKEDQQGKIKLPSILYSMTALVYGQVPDNWKPSRSVTVFIEPKWKKRKHGKEVPLQKEPVKLVPIESTCKAYQADVHVPLTTLRIETTYPSSSTVCQLVRIEGHGVVGDAYCRQEYQKLKRSIRNRIKDKLCIGCYQLQLDDVVIKQEIPKKLLATFWDTHCGDDNNKK